MEPTKFNLGVPRSLVFAAFGVVVLVVAVVGFRQYSTFLVSPPLSVTISPDILYLTQPVYGFYGKVEAINGSTLTLGNTVTLAPEPQPSGNKPQTKKLTFYTNVTSKTTISKQSPQVVYFFKTNPLTDPSNWKLSLKDIKVGDQVNVVSSVDLRTISGNRFDATNILVSAASSALNGRISDIRGNTLIVKATYRSAEQTFEVLVNDNTEISRIGFSGDATKQSKPERFSLSDLKKDMQVMVYTDGDASKQTKLTALRVEPVSVAPTRASSTPASRSGQL